MLATSTIRRKPPRTTSAVTTHNTKPVNQDGEPKVFWAAIATEFAWTILPIPKAANATSAANITPSQRQFRFFARMYIAPPRMMP